MKTELGKILIDIAKLVLGGVILSGLMKENIPSFYLFLNGSIAVVAFITAGLYLIKNNKK